MFLWWQAVAITVTQSLPRRITGLHATLRNLFALGCRPYLHSNNNLGASIVFVSDCNDDVDPELVFGWAKGQRYRRQIVTLTHWQSDGGGNWEFTCVAIQSNTNAVFQLGIVNPSCATDGEVRAKRITQLRRDFTNAKLGRLVHLFFPRRKPFHITRICNLALQAEFVPVSTHKHPRFDGKHTAVQSGVDKTGWVWDLLPASRIQYQYDPLVCYSLRRACLASGLADQSYFIRGVDFSVAVWNFLTGTTESFKNGSMIVSPSWLSTFFHAPLMYSNRKQSVREAQWLQHGFDYSEH